MGELRDRMESDLRLRRRSENTCVVYLRCVRAFAAYHRRSPAELGEPEVRAFLTHLVDERRVSASTHGVYAAALRFLYAVTLRRPDNEFIRRFLLHVLPARFVKIRHFGLFAPGRAAAAHRDRARRLLAAPSVAASPEDWRTLFRRLTGIDLTRCPRCRRGTMIATPLAPRAPFTHDRAPPLRALA